MRLTFPGAATSMARLVTLLVLLWTGVRPVRRLDVVLVQALAERTGVELQQPGGLLSHRSAVRHTGARRGLRARAARNARLAAGQQRPGVTQSSTPRDEPTSRPHRNHTAP